MAQTKLADKAKPADNWPKLEATPMTLLAPVLYGHDQRRLAQRYAAASDDLLGGHPILSTTDSVFVDRLGGLDFRLHATLPHGLQLLDTFSQTAQLLRNARQLS